MFMQLGDWATRRVEAATRCLHRLAQPVLGGAAPGAPSMPKIPAMITSSVIACIRGASENGRPIGQRVDLAFGDRRRSSRV